METIPVRVKPFVKWAGGKGQLLEEIRTYYPFREENITKYAEPFVGGGAVLFDIVNCYNLEFIYIGDINAQLINTYLMVRDEIEELIELLSKYQEEYIPLDTESRKEYYTKKREYFNKIILHCEAKERVEQAALMIFLNKTCFNGLYRVNKKGLFNVPIGAYKKPIICDEENLRAASDKLAQVNIVWGDYHKSAEFIDNRTFVYLDPPYRPITQTSNFTAYTQNTFNDEEQRELAQFVDMLNSKKARIVVSNSDPKNIDKEDNFFDKLYAGYNIKRVYANRMINSNSTGRGKITELIISNY